MGQNTGEKLPVSGYVSGRFFIIYLMWHYGTMVKENVFLLTSKNNA